MDITIDTYDLMIVIGMIFLIGFLIGYGLGRDAGWWSGYKDLRNEVSKRTNQTSISDATDLAIDELKIAAQDYSVIQTRESAEHKQ